MTFFSPYFSPEMMVKFTRSASGHFVMLVPVSIYVVFTIYLFTQISEPNILKGIYTYTDYKDTKYEVPTYTYTDYNDTKYKVPIERVYNFSQLHKGDHIAIERFDGVYSHHAIVEDVETENDTINVIEYSFCVKENLQDVNKPWSPEKAKVMRGKYRLKDGLFLIKHKKCLPADTVVLRARRRLGERKYNLLHNNCEHFALWCKTGISSSGQVKKHIFFMVAAQFGRRNNW